MIDDFSQQLTWTWSARFKMLAFTFYISAKPPTYVSHQHFYFTCPTQSSEYLPSMFLQKTTDKLKLDVSLMLQL